MAHSPIRLAMIGGGTGSFIGPVHSMAATLDGQFRLVAGAFSRNAASSRATGERYGLCADRVHADWRSLLEAERERPDAAELVSITAPNAVHFPAACAALEAGFAVLSDKPATATLEEAEELAAVVAATGRPYGLTYTYSGYPMVREARARVAAGVLGRIRKVVVEYEQGWLSRPIERTDDRQARWRTDPAAAGIGGCLGDIGVHAFHLAEFISGERVASVCADVGRVVAGRVLDDDAAAFLRFASGARGVLVTSQVSTGARNGIAIRVYGEEGGLRWTHERPDQLVLHLANGGEHVIYAGSDDLSPTAMRAARLPAGHPEGLIEAFATIYRDFATSLRSGDQADRALVAGIDEGLRSMRFVARALQSSEGGCWIEMES